MDGTDADAGMDEKKDVEVDIGMDVITDGVDDVEGDVDVALAMDEVDDVEVNVGMEVVMMEVVDIDREMTMDEVDEEVDATKDAEVGVNVEFDDKIGIRDDVVTVDVEDTDTMKSKHVTQIKHKHINY